MSKNITNDDIDDIIDLFSTNCKITDKNILHNYFTKLKKYSSKSLKIETIHNYITNCENKDIYLLNDKEVIKWLFEDFSFLEIDNDVIKSMTKTQKNKYFQSKENEWGRCKIGSDNLWTGKFGEEICKELYVLQNYTVIKKKKVKTEENNYELDLYIEELDLYLEVKTGTYFTPGTAWEKILGVPFKYCNIGKLFIICLGDIEKKAKKHIIYTKESERKEMIKFYSDNKNIDYVCITELMKELVDY